MDASDNPSSPGLRRLEAACSSPSPHASRAPLSSSSSSAPDLPPHRTSAPLAEPSASSSHEVSKPRDLIIEVHLATRDGLETVMATFHSSHTVNDVKEYFEEVKGRDVFCAENMVIYHDGSKLTSMTVLGTLGLETWNSILITSEVDISSPSSNVFAPIPEAMVGEGLTIPIDYLPLVTTNEDFGYECDVSLSELDATEYVLNHLDSTTARDSDHPSTWSGSNTAEFVTAIGETPVGIAESSETENEDFGLTRKNVSLSAQEDEEHIVNQFNSTAIDYDYPSMLGQNDIDEVSTAVPEIRTSIAQTALTTQETSPAVAEPSANIVTPTCSHVLIGRVLTPVTPAGFPDQLLSNSQLHGFKTVNELINEINRGPPKWITKKQALGLLSNAEMFAISDVKEDTKKNGLTCVIDSTKCQISSTLGGYSTAANVPSSEYWIGKMKEKGMEMDWFEVKGKLWSRRRLVFREGDGVFHLLQWKQHQNTETTDAAARASTSGQPTSQELRHGISDTATGASTPGERTEVLGEEISVGARGGGFEEIRALIQDLQTAVNTQLSQFESHLQRIDSHLQRIDTRVQAIEQQHGSTPTTGSTLDCRQSSSNANPDPPSDD